MNIVGFTFFTGIHRDTLNGWVNGVQLASSGSDICKKIDEMREESLVGLQVSGKGNPMNYMPSLNKYCGFNMPGVRDQGSRARALTAEELPRLGANNCIGLPNNSDNSGYQIKWNVSTLLPEHDNKKKVHTETRMKLSFIRNEATDASIVLEPTVKKKIGLEFETNGIMIQNVGGIN